MKLARLKQEKLVDIILVNSADRIVSAKQYKLNYSIYTDYPKDPVQGAVEQNKAYQKINYLIDDILGGSIAYTLPDKDIIDKFFADYDNNFVTLPTMSELSLVECLHCKFNTLCGDYTYVDSVEIIDTFNNLSVFYLTDDDDYTLPQQDKFAGELAFFEQPWWLRYDTTTFDNFAETQEGLDHWHKEIKTEEFDRMTVCILHDIDDEITRFLSNDPDDVSKGELISMDEIKEKIKEKEKWKPRLV